MTDAKKERIQWLDGRLQCAKRRQRELQLKVDEQKQRLTELQQQLKATQLELREHLQRDLKQCSGECKALQRQLRTEYPKAYKALLRHRYYERNMEPARQRSHQQYMRSKDRRQQRAIAEATAQAVAEQLDKLRPMDFSTFTIKVGGAK